MTNVIETAKFTGNRNLHGCNSLKRLELRHLFRSVDSVKHFQLVPEACVISWKISGLKLAKSKIIEMNAGVDFF